MDSKFDKIFEMKMNEAGGRPSPAHERLKNELTDWAIARGYRERIQFESGIPDVLLQQDNGEYLFVGDAKNAKNENDSNSETVSRISGYFKEFCKLLKNGYKGGILAIATNSKEAAESWVPELNTLAKVANIAPRGGGNPNFQVLELNPGKTWITYW